MMDGPGEGIGLFPIKTPRLAPHDVAGSRSAQGSPIFRIEERTLLQGEAAASDAPGEHDNNTMRTLRG